MNTDLGDLFESKKYQGTIFREAVPPTRSSAADLVVWVGGPPGIRRTFRPSAGGAAGGWPGGGAWSRGVAPGFRDPMKPPWEGRGGDGRDDR